MRTRLPTTFNFGRSDVTPSSFAESVMTKSKKDPNNKRPIPRGDAKKPPPPSAPQYWQTASPRAREAIEDLLAEIHEKRTRNTRTKH